jgi:glycosyltransferase involved in cell wall biosynthesis
MLMRAAIVIPAYNEAQTIRDVAQRALRQGEPVIVVDDGSTDGTGQTLDGLPIVLLRHESNRGKAAALCTGFAYALAHDVEAIVTLDGDDQHKPEDVPRLIAAARLYPHRLIVAARLLGREQYPRARYFANRFADFWLSWAAGHAIADSQSGQRLYPAVLLKQLWLRHDIGAAFTLESEILIDAARLGYTCVCVPILAIYNPAGRRSHFRPVRDIARIVRMVAYRLLTTAMNLPGLWRCLRQSPCVVDSPQIAEPAEPATGRA